MKTTTINFNTYTVLFLLFYCGRTLLTLHRLCGHILLDQTLLRSLHLPKNNSLYVLTPDIAPSASTSKNRYLELSYSFFSWHILSILPPIFLCSENNGGHALVVPIMNTGWQSMSSFGNIQSSGLAANTTVIGILRDIWPFRCTFIFSHPLWHFERNICCCNLLLLCK